MAYSKLSTLIARHISRELKLDDNKQIILAYAVENLLLTIYGFGLIILVGFLLNALVPCITAALAGAVLRRFSGGAHAQTPARCLVYGTIGYGLIGFFSKLLTEHFEGNIEMVYLIMPLMLSLFLAAVLAPVDCNAKPIKSITLRKKLKFGSVGFIMLCCLVVLFLDNPLIQVPLVLGITYQSLTLLPFFNQRR